MTKIHKLLEPHSASYQGNQNLEKLQNDEEVETSYELNDIPVA